MSLLARHRYIISRLTEAFELEEILVEEMMLMPEPLQSINNFFSAEGPTKIIITVDDTPQQHTKLRLQSGGTRARDELGSPEKPRPSKSLIVHNDDVSCTTTLAVFFIKVKKTKNGDDHFAVDATKFNDGSLSFGVIRDPLESLELLMRCVYRPMIQDLNTDIWGEATHDQRNEFTVCMDTFIRGLQDNIRNLSAGLELPKPDSRLETIGINAASTNPVLVTTSMNLLYEWCRNIENYLDDSNRSRWETPDSGPDTELSYWRNRLQRYCTSPLPSSFYCVLTIDI